MDTTLRVDTASSVLTSDVTADISYGVSDGMDTI